MQSVVIVLYECDRDADLMALLGYVRGWGKRNVDAERLAAGYRRGAERRGGEEYLRHKVFVIILCQWYSKVHYGR
ncbi:hypothetical protein [Nostoc sp.]|uniref:hypothetical protein n=1 Tax=Nostoc sp. TaxID=1180 RepID=UPI002FFC8D40